MEFILVMIETANFKSDTLEELLEDRRRTAAWMTNLAQAGQLLNVEQFDTGHTGPITVRRDRNRRLSVSAGPFAGEGERLAGYVIVKADHFEEAVEIAKTCDASGAIEVRALRVAM
jgi:hypothetical protein